MYRSSSYQENLYDAIANEKQYFNLLKAADEQTFKDQFEAEILLLLDEAQIKAYSRHSTLAERKSFMEYFWRAQNPNPLLPQNDRLLAHLIRRAYARENFPYREPPYFADRSKYFIKYGRPMFRYQELAGRRHIGSLVNIRQNSYSVKANESWSYVNVWPNYVVHFAREDHYYKEIKSLKEVIIGNQRRGLYISKGY